MKGKKFVVLVVICVFAMLVGTQTKAKELHHWDDLLKLEFPGAYLTEESAARMHDEIDFQRACQAYL